MDYDCRWYISALYPQHEVKAGWQQQKGISHLSGLPATFQAIACTSLMVLLHGFLCRNKAVQPTCSSGTVTKGQVKARLCFSSRFNEKNPELPSCPHLCLLTAPQSCTEEHNGKTQYPHGICYAHLFLSNYHDTHGEPPRQSLHRYEWRYFSKGLVKWLAWWLVLLRHLKRSCRRQTLLKSWVHSTGLKYWWGSSKSLALSSFASLEMRRLEEPLTLYV